MKNLFDQQTTKTIIQRIHTLNPSMIPLWGKMSVTQMLTHSSLALQVALGEMQLKRTLMGRLLGGMAKKKLLDAHPFGKNYPTAKEFIIKEDKNFEEEKQKLIDCIQRFSSGGAAGVSKAPHPFFGKMTADEWSYSGWKHLDHHLRQFGV